MKPLLILALGAGLAVGACGTTTSDAVDTSSSDATDRSSGPVDASSSDPATTSPETAETPLSAGSDAAAPALHVYPEVTIPSGTWLPLVLTSPVGSDTSRVEDAVAAELTQAITIDGREALPAGTQLAGVVTGVDGSGRATGRAMVAFRFTSLRTGDQLYDVEAAPLLQLAPATKWEDVTNVGIGTGVLIGGLLVGVDIVADGVADGAADGVVDGVADGVADGAAVGGDAGVGVVLAMTGEEVRFQAGADASTELTAPLTVRVPAN